MASQFLFDESGVHSVLNDLRSSLSDYKTNITALENLVSSMESSGAWKDETLKSSFIATAKAYISNYKNFSSGIESYITALQTKANNFSEHESNFS